MTHDSAQNPADAPDRRSAATVTRHPRTAQTELGRRPADRMRRAIPPRRSRIATGSADGAEAATDRAARVVWLGGGHAEFGPDQQRQLHLAGDGTTMVTLVRTLGALEELLSAGTHPDLVLSRLFWAGGDVLEAARLLTALNYSGPYRAVAPALPQPGIVRDEVLRMAPDIDFDLVQLDGLSPPF